jgi:hypothetical protein
MRKPEAKYETFLDDLIDEIFEEAAKEWTWSEFAKEAGVAYTTVCRLGERITRFPELRTIYLMAGAVGMDVKLIKHRVRMARAA